MRFGQYSIVRYDDGLTGQRVNLGIIVWEEVGGFAYRFDSAIERVHAIDGSAPVENIRKQLQAVKYELSNGLRTKGEKALEHLSRFFKTGIQVTDPFPVRLSSATEALERLYSTLVTGSVDAGIGQKSVEIEGIEASRASSLLERCGVEGVTKWNLRRKQGKKIGSLCDLDLSKRNLAGVDLSHADLSRANLFDADLRGANLLGANLDCADLRLAKLNNAIFCSASLRGTLLQKCDLTEACFGQTVVACNMSEVIGINKIVHVAPSIIDTNYPLLLKNDTAKQFLLGCGFNPKKTHDFVKQTWEAPVYIAASNRDREFLDLLSQQFKQNGVLFWRWPTDVALQIPFLSGVLDFVPYDRGSIIIFLASKFSLEELKGRSPIESHSSVRLELALPEIQGNSRLTAVRLDSSADDWFESSKSDLKWESILDARGWDSRSSVKKKVMQELLGEVKSQSHSKEGVPMPAPTRVIKKIRATGVQIKKSGHSRNLQKPH